MYPRDRFLDQLIEQGFEAYRNGATEKVEYIIKQILNTRADIDSLYDVDNLWMHLLMRCESGSLPKAHCLVAAAYKMVLVNGSVLNSPYAVASAMNDFCERTFEAFTIGKYSSLKDIDILEKIAEDQFQAIEVMSDPDSVWTEETKQSCMSSRHEIGSCIHGTVGMMMESTVRFDTSHLRETFPTRMYNRTDREAAKIRSRARIGSVPPTRQMPRCGGRGRSF